MWHGTWCLFLEKSWVICLQGSWDPEGDRRIVLLMASLSCPALSGPRITFVSGGVCVM